jgi:hypothetical protein
MTTPTFLAALDSLMNKPRISRAAVDFQRLVNEAADRVADGEEFKDIAIEYARQLMDADVEFDYDLTNTPSFRFAVALQGSAQVLKAKGPDWNEIMPALLSITAFKAMANAVDEKADEIIATRKRDAAIERGDYRGAK